MRNILCLAGAVAALASCDTPTACADYVDYMCACHADDPGFSCADLRAAYASTTPEVEDQCTIDLEDQQAADDAAGLDCTAPAQ